MRRRSIQGLCHNGPKIGEVATRIGEKLAATGVTFSDASIADVELYGRLQRATFGWTLGGIGVQDHERQLRTLFASSRARSKSFSLIATQAGRFAGYVAGQPFAPLVDGSEHAYVHSEVGVIPQLVVVDRHRRQGVGAALLEAATDRLRQYEFSMALAHITADLTSWYSSQGWTIMPPGTALAWIETNRPGSDMMMPAHTPAEARADHTAAFTQPPLRKHGYDRLAFRLTGAQSGMIVASFFTPSEDAEQTRIACARSLVAALEVEPAAMRRLAPTSAVLLYMESLTREEQIAYLASRANPSA